MSRASAPAAGRGPRRRHCGRAAATVARGRRRRGNRLAAACLAARWRRDAASRWPRSCRYAAGGVFGGRPGAFFRPLVLPCSRCSPRCSSRSRSRRRSASLFPGGGRERTPRSVRACAAVPARQTRSVARRPSLVAGAASSLLGRPRSWPSAARRCRPSRTGTCWAVGPPGTSQPGMDRITLGRRGLRARGRRERRRPRRPGGNADQVERQLQRAVGEHRVGRDYDSTIDAIERTSSAATPALRPKVRRTPREPHARVGSDSAGPRSGVFGQDLDVLRRGGRGAQPSPGSTASSARGRAPATSPTSRSRSTSRRPGGGIKPGDVRRAEATLLPGIQVGSCSRSRRSSRSIVKGMPETRRSVSERPQPADRQARRRSRRAWATSPTCGSARRRRHQAGRRLALPRRRGRRQRAQRRRGRDDIEDRLDGIGFPLEYHAEVLGDDADKAVGSSAGWSLRARRRDRDLPAAAGRVRQLAAGARSSS